MRIVDAENHELDTVSPKNQIYKKPGLHRHDRCRFAVGHAGSAILEE